MLNYSLASIINVSNLCSCMVQITVN